MIAQPKRLPLPLTKEERRTKIAVSVVWLIFAILFAILGTFSYVQSTRSVSPFSMLARPLQSEESPVQAELSVFGADIDQPLKEFIGNFNDHIDKLNKNTSESTRLAACGYYLAALVALVSLVLERRELLRKWRGLLRKLFNKVLP